MRVHIGGVGLIGPGLTGWDASCRVLAGIASYIAAPTIHATIEALAPAERRRLGVPIKLALGAGLDAFRKSTVEPKAAATVFTSSGGDGENVHQICLTLASSDRQVSPTRFHNAVHNAAAGYWSITTGAQTASTSICCHDGSVAAGLLEAAVQVSANRAAVALIAYDHRYPEPLHTVRPISADLGFALIFLPQGHSRLPCLDIAVTHSAAPATRMSEPLLENLRLGVPSGRGLPLLAALARGTDATVVLDYLDGMQLRVTLTAKPALT
jgi:hypothetical protein